MTILPKVGVREQSDTMPNMLMKNQLIDKLKMIMQLKSTIWINMLPIQIEIHILQATHKKKETTRICQ